MMQTKLLPYCLKAIALMLFINFCSIKPAQAQAWIWAKSPIGGNAANTVSVTSPFAGSIYAVGNFKGASVSFGSDTLANSGNSDMYLVRYDTLGNVVWAQRAGGTGLDQATSVSLDAYGNIYVCGYYQSPNLVFGPDTLTNLGYQNAFLVKYDTAGNVIWAKNIGGTNTDEAVGVATDASGNVVVAGSFNSPSIMFGSITVTNYSLDGTDNMFVAKLDSTGATIWANQGMGNKIEGSAVAVDAIGDVYVSGYYNYSHVDFGFLSVANFGGYDMYLVKYNPSGTVAWARGTGGTGDDYAYALTATTSGVYIAGQYFSTTIPFGTASLTNIGAGDAFLAKCDTAGNAIWANNIGGADTESAYTIANDATNGIYVSGAFKSSSLNIGTSTLTNSGGYDVFVAKYDTSGTNLYATKVGGNGNDLGNSLSTGSIGNVYLGGGFSSATLAFSATELTLSGTQNAYLAKLNDTAIRPGIITGILSVCAGASTTLYNAISGGTWTSSNLSVATVDAVTGVVSGLSLGTDTISYTIGGFPATVVLNVDTPLVAGSISGATSLCMYSTTLFTDPVTGGRWHMSNGNATIDYLGNVTGAALGFDTVIYTDSNACGAVSTTKPITINFSPTLMPISGLSAVCPGSNITLSEFMTGGTWGATNGDATVSPVGVVHGVTAGIDTIFYSKSVPTCTTTVTQVITINPMPFAGTIYGPSIFCDAVVDTFTDSATGGVWGSLNPTLLSVSPAGLAIGITPAGGVATIAYSVINSCGGATATKTLTILPLANPGTITGTDSLCIGASVTLADTITGGTWSIQNGYALDSMGIVTAVAAGTDTVYYAVTNSCNTDSAMRVITIVPFPYVSGLTGDSGLCYGGSSLTLTDSVAGGTWTRSNAIVNVSSSGVVTSVGVGVDIITYTYTNLCGSVYTTKAITVDLFPEAGIIYGAPDSICSGSSSTFLETSPGGVWSDYNGYLFISGSTIFGAVPGPDTLYYTVTNSCSSVMTSKAMRIMPLPAAGIIAGPDSVCLFANVTFLASDAGGVWTIANANATVDSGVIYGLVLGMDTVMYVITNSCGSDTVNKSFYVKPLPILSPITGPDSLCLSTTITLSEATPYGYWGASNSNALVGSGVIYGQFIGVDTILYTSTNACGTSIATKAVTVMPQPLPATITGGDSLCVGSILHLTASHPGGVWASSLTSVATVVGGTVAGVATGTDSIFYTITNVCGSRRSYLMVRVLDTVPTFIYGNPALCVGASDTVLGSPLGGNWTTSNSSVSITPTTYGCRLTGAMAGTDTITYHTTNQCGTTMAQTVVQTGFVPTTSVIGISLFCNSKTDTLFGSPDGGVWSETNLLATPTAIANAVVLTSDTFGVDTITYSITNACGSNSFSFPVTIMAKAVCDSLNGVPVMPPVMLPISIYPNPTKGILNIDYAGAGDKTLSVRVLNYLGQTVYMGNLSLSFKGGKAQLDLGSNQPGVYLLQLADGENTTVTIRVVIGG